MKNIRFSYREAFYWFFSTFLGLFYVFFLSLMPNSWFRDRDNYLIYASEAESIIERYGEINVLFFNEPIFLYINLYLEKIIDYNYIPHFFVFFITTIFVFFLAYKSKNLFIFLLGIVLSLFIPYMIQGELVALRQGIATSIFILAFFFIKSEKKVAAILFLCALIHSIFFLFFLIWTLNFYFFKDFEFKAKLFFNFLMMLIFSFLFLVVAKFLGLRQGDEYQQSMEVQRSGGSFLLFFGVAIYLYLFGDKNDKRLYEFTLIGLVMFLTTYFLTPIAGRFFNTIIPFVFFLLVSRSRILDILLLVFLFIIFLFLFFQGSYLSLLAIPEAQFGEEFSNYLGGFLDL